MSKFLVEEDGELVILDSLDNLTKDVELFGKYNKKYYKLEELEVEVEVFIKDQEGVLL